METSLLWPLCSWWPITRRSGCKQVGSGKGDWILFVRSERYACDSKGIPHSRIFIHDLHNIWMSRYFGLTLFFVLLSDSGPLLLLEVWRLRPEPSKWQFQVNKSPDRQQFLLKCESYAILPSRNIRPVFFLNTNHASATTYISHF